MSRLVRVAGNLFWQPNPTASLFDVPTREAETLVAARRGLDAVRRGVITKNEYSDAYKSEFEMFEEPMPEVVLGVTNAPSDYDGFGTATVADFEKRGARHVAIRKEHLDWQVGRYGSGMCWFTTDFAEADRLCRVVGK